MIWLILAERLVVTGTATFSIGAIDAGARDGFSPGGHFDVGATFQKFRLAAELDAGLWSDEDAPTDQPESGSYRRVGGALRYYFMDFDVGNRRTESLLRLYVEGGIGRQSIDAPSVELARPDLMIGFGMQQQARLGAATLGGMFGLRVLVSGAPAPHVVNVACKGATCDPPGYRRHDLAVFFTMGFAVGK
jgi:hypothetical protein